MSRADDEGKEELKKQMDLIEKDIAGIRYRHFKHHVP